MGRLLGDVVTVGRLAVTSRPQLAAENLFLRKQLAVYQERRVKPRRADSATRVILVRLSRVLDWRSLLTVVKRHAHPVASSGLAAVLAKEVEARTTDSAGCAAPDRHDGAGRPDLGEERIANELQLKSGVKTNHAGFAHLRVTPGQLIQEYLHHIPERGHGVDEACSNSGDCLPP